MTRARQTALVLKWLIGPAITTGLLAMPAAAQTAAAPSVITVEGQASADLAPDAAHLTLGVEAERPTAAAATAEVARAAQAVADGLTADGIADKDVHTTAIGLEPIYPDDGPSPGHPRLPRAYRASTTFMLTVRPPERAGVVAAHAVDKGATGIDNLVFTASDQPKVVDGLRADAVREARRKAEVYVQALGLTLGRVLEIVPQEGGGFPAPMAFSRAAKSIIAAPTPAIPVLAGPLHLRTAVTVRFAIAD
jgi:uncharacterized protein YggE